MNKLKVAVFALLVGTCSLHVTDAIAQRTTVYTHEDADFKTGLELFQKQKYGSAQNIFRKVIETHPAYSLVRIDAEYYAALCAIELFNKDGELLLKDFIKKHPESPRVKTAYFYLGKYNYRKKKWDDVIQWLDKVDIYELSKPELSELYFKRGYAYFELTQYDKAKKDLYELKDVDTKYSAPANYYYSHIAYLQKNYETALQGFNRLIGHPSFGPVVPYYIAQTYYLQGKYDDVIKYAPPLLDSAGTKRAPEIARIIGESYYRTNKFKEAIPYLKKYEEGRGMYPKDYYQLAYAYYKTGDCDNAITYFKNTVSGNPQDTLAQNAYYHLGDCFIKKGNKDEARNAFGAASKIDVDKQVKEDALYNYAKLSYELAYNPFSDAIDAFQEYIRLYPNSPRVDEAYTYLVNVYLTTHNYKDALASIEKVKSLNEPMKTAYQKIAYFNGVELFNSSSPDYDEAIKSFDKSLKYKNDKTLAALAIYWKGESWYRKAEKFNRENNVYKKDYLENAVDNYTTFQAEPGAFNLSEYNLANYNIGYAYFQLAGSTNNADQQKALYREANIWFRKYTASRGKDAKDKKLSDAYVRTGDTYFMIKDYQGAEQSYTAAIDMKVRDVDYALYQRAQAYGVQQKREAKVGDLKTLTSQYPKSTYSFAGRFEMAKTMQLVGQSDQALSEFQKIINENPNSAFTGKAMMQIGLIYYEKGDMNKALDQFMKVIKRDNRSEEAKTAHITATNIAKKEGKTETVIVLAEMMGQSVSTTELDSIAFQAAKKHYAAMDCDKAIPALDSYISKFPQGLFIIDANFYRAECSYGKGNMEAALTGYNFVISKNSGRFLESSYAKAAIINFQAKKFQEAAANYLELEKRAEKPENVVDARVGLMRSYYWLKNFEGAIEYSNKIVADENMSPEIVNEARFTIARASLETEKYDQALNEFSRVANALKNEMGAESKYYVSYIRYLQNDYNESKRITFELIKQYQSYPYWMAKGLILLADNYVALKDNFQAKHALKSVIEKSEYPDLVREAQQKLDAIIKSENDKLQRLPSEDIKIEFNESKLDYKHLFVEPAEMPEPVQGGQQ